MRMVLLYITKKIHGNTRLKIKEKGCKTTGTFFYPK
jgi:hypothetical protein